MGKTQNKNGIPFENDLIWLDALTFIFGELLGQKITEEWFDSSECPSLEDIKEDETPFDPEIKLTNWQKKLFQISGILEIIVRKRDEKYIGKLIESLSEDERAEIKETFGLAKLGQAFRQLFWAILFKSHPELMGKFGVGIRKAFKVVKASLPELQPQIMPIDPGELQKILDQIKGGKPPGRMN